MDDFFDPVFAAIVKTQRFSWRVYSALYLVESLKLLRHCIRHGRGKSWNLSHYSELKRSSQTKINNGIYRCGNYTVN